MMLWMSNVLLELLPLLQLHNQMNSQKIHLNFELFLKKLFEN